MKLFLAALFIMTHAYAVDPYKMRTPGYEPVCDPSKVELKNLPPVRDQGNYGLCYAHSSHLLLEYLRCSNSSDPSKCYASQGSLLHLARFNNTRSEDLIRIGGIPKNIFTNFSANRNLAPESCAEYEDWKNLDQYYRDERKLLGSNATERNEVDYFYYVSNRLKNNASSGEKSCFVDDLVGAGLSQSAQEIMDVLNRGKDLSWEELRYELLVPKSCRMTPVSYPSYSIQMYPKSNERKSFKGYRDFIFRSLSAGVPVEASFKSSDNGYHSATIVGQRHVCDRDKCELQFKIQNSYGQSWQNYNDGGWVDAKNLTDHMADFSMGLSTILPAGKALDTSLEGPYYINSPLDRGTVFSDVRKCWHVTSTDHLHRGENPPPQVPLTQPSARRSERGVWRCVKDGRISFVEYAIDGQECKKMN